MASGVFGRGVPGRRDGARRRGPRAQAPTIAAAANLNFALTEIAERSRRAGREASNLVFGASGTLTRQIQDGAPFELFLAADEEFPQTARRGRPDARRRRRVRRRAGWRSSRRAVRRSRSTNGSTGSPVC